MASYVCLPLPSTGALVPALAVAFKIAGASAPAVCRNFLREVLIWKCPLSPVSIAPGGLAVTRGQDSQQGCQRHKPTQIDRPWRVFQRDSAIARWHDDAAQAHIGAINSRRTGGDRGTPARVEHFAEHQHAAALRVDTQFQPIGLYYGECGTLGGAFDSRLQARGLVDYDRPPGLESPFFPPRGRALRSWL